MGRSEANYPPQLRDHLFAVGALSPQSRVLNLAAGNGQLAMLIAQVADSVIAMDDEVDVSQASIQATSAHAAIQWIQGSDRDLGRVITEAIDLVLIGFGFESADQQSLLENLDLLVSEQGSVVLCYSDALTQGSTIDSAVTLLAASAFPQVEPWSHERPNPDDPGGTIRTTALVAKRQK